jgi:hypothetical protein
MRLSSGPGRYDTSPLLRHLEEFALRFSDRQKKGERKDMKQEKTGNPRCNTELSKATQVLTNFPPNSSQPLVCPLMEKRKKRQAGKSPCDPRCRKSKISRKGKKRLVVSRGVVARSRSGPVSRKRVDELIRCSLCSRLSLPLKALHFYLVWKNSPTSLRSRNVHFTPSKLKVKHWDGSILSNCPRGSHRTGGVGEEEESHLCRSWS